MNARRRREPATQRVQRQTSRTDEGDPEPVEPKKSAEPDMAGWKKVVFPELRTLENPFIAKLYTMVSQKALDSIISWTDNGETFTIHKPMDFAEKVLRQYFAHNKLASFLRQVNTYGFAKLNPDTYTYGNPNFKKGKTDALHLIKSRKGYRPRGTGVGGTGVVVEAGAWGDVQSDVDRLKRDKEALHSEIVKLRQQYDQQNQVLGTVISELQSTREQQRGLSASVSKIFNHLSTAWASGEGLLKDNPSRVTDPKRRRIGQLEDVIANPDLPPMLTYDADAGDVVSMDTTNAGPSPSIPPFGVPQRMAPSDTQDSLLGIDSMLRDIVPQYGFAEREGVGGGVGGRNRDGNAVNTSNTKSGSGEVAVPVEEIEEGFVLPEQPQSEQDLGFDDPGVWNLESSDGLWGDDSTLFVDTAGHVRY